MIDVNDIRPYAEDYPRKPLGFTRVPQDFPNEPVTVYVDSTLIRKEFEIIRITYDGGTNVIYQVDDPWDEGTWTVNGQIRIDGQPQFYERGYRRNGFDLITKSVEMSADSKTLILDSLSPFVGSSREEKAVIDPKQDRIYLVGGVTGEIVRFNHLESKAIRPDTFTVAATDANTIELELPATTNNEHDAFLTIPGVVYYVLARKGDETEWISFESAEVDDSPFKLGEPVKLLGVKRGLFGTERIDDLTDAELSVPAQLVNVERGAFGSTKAVIAKDARLQIVGIVTHVQFAEFGVGSTLSPFSNTELVIQATIAHEFGHAMGLFHIPETIMAKVTFQGQYEHGSKHGDMEYENSKLFIYFTDVNHQLLNFEKHLTKKQWIINE